MIKIYRFIEPGSVLGTGIASDTDVTTSMPPRQIECENYRFGVKGM